MALQMARPYKHPRTGVYYFRQRVPTDLRRILGDKIVSRSLHTKDRDAAKLRNVEEVRKQAIIWEGHRKKPEPIPLQQIVALSGVLYRNHMAAMALEPGEPQIWIETLALLDRVAADPEKLAEWYGPTVDNLLLEQGIVTDDTSRLRLIQETDRAFRQVASEQLKRSEGDFSPDPKANRFPPVMASNSVRDGAPEGTSIRALFLLWERDHLAEGKAAKTVGDFRQKIEALIEYIGHDDAQRLTPENVVDWCDHLRHDKGLSARTVSQKYLAAVKIVFGLAVEKRKLKSSPAEDTKVRWVKKPKTRDPGFTDAEAKAILTAALASPDKLGDRRTEENKRAIRWAPWICAFTGSRITEATQLRTEDLIEEDGVLCLRITPDAGSVKARKFRVVLIHPQLLEMGLPEMIRSLPSGPIFYSTAFKRRAANPLSRARSASAKVGEWVREVVKITDPRLQPNHAWRHRFKTVARDAKIDLEVRDAIQGHEDGRAASGYGEVSIKAKWDAVQRLPRFDVRLPVR